MAPVAAQPQLEFLHRRNNAAQAKPAFRRASFGPETVAYFDAIAEEYPRWRKKMDAHIRHTIRFLKAAIPPNKKILLIGCANYEILSALSPSVGVGIDISAKLVDVARRGTNDGQNGKISFECTFPEDFKSEHRFDYVLVLNNSDYALDLMALVGALPQFLHEDSRVLFSMLNPLWHPLVKLASRLKIRIPDAKRNFLSPELFGHILELKRLKPMDTCRRILVPKAIPLVSGFLNTFVARLPWVNKFCFLQYVMAKPYDLNRPAHLSASVIIPCYNEEGNVRECALRVPQMGTFTEVIIVDDGSKDRTLEIAHQVAKENPHVKVVSYGANRGKGCAVMEGIRNATGDVLMILDADMTVPPEELVEFHEALETETADFVSGTRFVYPMEKEAMRFANYLGNLMFSSLVEIIVGAYYSDTLCGTKVMRRRDFSDMKLEDRSWGDFDFIFHASQRRLKGIQLPVHYKSRVSGDSKMKPFQAGIKFLRLCLKKWTQLP